MIDTHCHLTSKGLGERVEEVVMAARAGGVDRMITIGTTPVDAVRAQGVAERYEGVYFAAGVHPHYAGEVAMHELPGIVELAQHEKCVAFGEMGLDYHYDDPDPKLQHEFFQAQLEVVRYSEMRLPIIIHSRKATDDTIAHINASGLEGERFVFHCFTEQVDDCKKVLDLGAMISFTGIVTFNNAKEVAASAKLVPVERVMVETDAPYLAPEPHRKVRPNEPKYVVHTARFLAELKGVDEAEFVKQMDANAERFFGLG